MRNISNLKIFDLNRGMRLDCAMSFDVVQPSQVQATLDWLQFNVALPTLCGLISIIIFGSK